MTLVDQLVQISTGKNAPFLLIGGHAVAAHGFSRHTYDLDLLIDKNSRQIWTHALSLLGYSQFHDGGAFLQFTPPAGAVPLDLMLVGNPTFTAMLAAARDINWGGAVVKIPSLDHLLALKLHALKSAPSHRRIKDMHDILSLIEINKMDMRTEKFRQLCEKYANLEVYEKIVRIAA